MNKTVPDYITVQGKLEFLDEKDKYILDDIMRRWNACVRYAYQRLLEGQEKKKLKRELQTIFRLNSRYVSDAIWKSEMIKKGCEERGNNPKKVVFGGRKPFERLSKKHLSEKERTILKQIWKDRRQGNLLSRGDKGRPLTGRELLLPGVGAMAVPNTASWGWDSLKKADNKYPSQRCATSVHFC